jgi:hypothetical protein
MRVRVMHGLKQTLGAEFFKGQQVDEDLTPPAKQQAVDGAAVLEAFECGA